MYIKNIKLSNRAFTMTMMKKSKNQENISKQDQDKHLKNK